MTLTHHAYYIEGPLSQFESYQTLLKPFFARHFERFGIDEARELSAATALKHEGEALYLVGASSITTEAQQALLKLFEEPQPGVVLVLLLPHGLLLPTLRSRCLPFPHHPAQGTALSKARLDLAFLRATQKERSAYIAELLKEEEGVKERVRDFIHALERELSKQIGNTAAREGLRDIAMVRGYVGDRSPSLKMLLEHLALALPTHRSNTSKKEG